MAPLKTAFLKEKSKEPKLYFVVLTSIVAKQYSLPSSYAHYGIYTTLEEAMEQALTTIEEDFLGTNDHLNFKEVPWKLAAKVIISAPEINRLFLDHKRTEEEKRIAKKNLLMKEIINTKNVDLFTRNKEYFSTSEKRYIVDRLNANADEGHTRIK